MAGTPLKDLRVFQKLCGRDAVEKVYLTTTMWDKIEPNDGEKRLNELSMDYWKAMITQGAHIARCRSDDDSPRRLVRHIAAQESARKVLLQEKIAEWREELSETAAGQQLYSQREELVGMQAELLERINMERRPGGEPDLLVGLETEYDDLQAQINDKLRQIQELKFSSLDGPLHVSISHSQCRHVR